MRRNLISQLTGIERTKVNRMVRELTGRPAPAGLLAFTDSWYLESDLRLLHAAVAWRLYRRMTPAKLSLARVILNVFDAYRLITLAPVLDINRIAIIPHLMASRIWCERVCCHCQLLYLTPIGDPRQQCPGCRIYYRYRCDVCGRYLDPKATGRRRLCSHRKPR